MKHVVIYEPAPDVLARAEPVMAQHVERIDEFHQRGELLMVGTFAEPQRDGSMSIFRSREAALEFVAGDPFILHGVVRGWRMLEWNEVLVP
jgi:uncharacterized protein YciI